MRSFQEWLQCQEAAVPQTVDLTNGGKKKDGMRYAGAAPDTGVKDFEPPRDKKKLDIPLITEPWTPPAAVMPKTDEKD